MFKTNVCVTSDMVHKTHIKPTISVHIVNFQQKTSSWLISNISISYILSQNYIFWTRNMLSWLHSQIPVTLQPCSLDQEAGVCDDNLHRACTWFFSRQSSIGTWQILEGCAGFPEKPTGRMPGRCFCHYFCMLPHLQIVFGNDIVWQLCASWWQCKYSAWFCSNAGCEWIIENFLNF